MNILIAEFIKLKRSLSWGVVVLLPLMAVFSGAVTTFVLQGGFEDGWHTLWMRSIGFYGMALLPVGIAILASLVWRVEHRDGNWNALMGSSTPTGGIVLAKTVAVAALAGLMQVVLLVSVLGLGKLAFGLPGMLPPQYFASSLLVVIACLPVAALQSGLSTFFGSFAVPVAIALLGTGISTMALLVGPKVAVLLPYATATYATQLGTILVDGAGTSFNADPINAGSVTLVASVTVAMTALLVAGTIRLLDRTDSWA